MATYTQLYNGTSGDDVRKMQQALVDKGYDLGSAGADGIFGSITEGAVRRYQQDNGLVVDGVAGNQTLGSLYSTASTGTSGGTNATGTAVDNAAVSDNEKYNQQLKDYGYEKYDQQLNDLYQQIANRDKFSYNINEDALYQQYVDQYSSMGKLAMQDTMGQAAALTGGYGNSYAETAGQQAYQRYLQQVNDVVPELHAMARDQYDQEGQDLLTQYSMLGDMRDTEYQRYQDKLDQYWKEKNFNYQKEQDDYNNLVNLITSTGYAPSADELQAAGMSKKEAETLAQYYAQLGSTSETADDTFEKAVFSRMDMDGNYVYYIGGKEYTFAAGVNPYTGTKNSDTKYGAFSNGYQPNNINGQKLTKSGITDVVNGVRQNVWQTSDGKLWIWDGTQNKYLRYEDDEAVDEKTGSNGSSGGAAGSRRIEQNTIR